MFKANKKIFLTAIISLIILISVFLLSLCVGAVKVNFTNVIFYKLRLPRSLLVLITGILLGGSGAVFQLFFRNPLAEPGLMGISSGATLGAVLADTLGIGTLTFNLIISPLNLFAFCGAILAGFIVTVLASGKSHEISSVMILLCGTALGTLYSAISSLLLLVSDKEMRSIYSWILGSFNGRGWNEFWFILIPAVISITMMFFMANPLDLLTGGEKSAVSLGLNVARLRILVLITGALAVSAAVCAGGTISFVGLIAPHVVRKTCGSKGKILIPFSMIFGAILVLVADTIARVVILPGELPAGIITSILGVPFFLSLILGARNNE